MGQSASSDHPEQPSEPPPPPPPSRGILAASQRSSRLFFRSGEAIRSANEPHDRSEYPTDTNDDNDDDSSQLNAATEHRSNVNVSAEEEEMNAVAVEDDESLTFNEGSDESTPDTESFAPTDQAFHPVRDPHWMFRSIETLVLGQQSTAPILTLEDDEDKSSSADESFSRRRSTASTFGGFNNRRGSLSQPVFQGGTLASYYRRATRRSSSVGEAANSTQTAHRRRSSVTAIPGSTSPRGACSRKSTLSHHVSSNIVLRLYSREHLPGRRYVPPSSSAPVQTLREMGGTTLLQRLDGPASGIVSEVAFLAAALDSGDWSETQSIVSRLLKRLVGGGHEQQQHRADRDPNVPPQAPKYYAGGGRYGLERDAFCLAGGVELLIRIFQETFVVGDEVASSRDARDLSPSTVTIRLSSCWNETLGMLRELVYFLPSIVQKEQWDEFLPFLFTLLSHDSCFEYAAALIEEVLTAKSQRPFSQASAFYLGSIPNVHKLWQDLKPQYLCLFCRILALIVFEPEDRVLLESPSVLKSLDLLQLRRNRATRRDPIVDMNQALVLGDKVLLQRLVKLLTVMNYAPPVRRFTPYHVLSRHPFIADTLVMLGLDELTDWGHIDRLDSSARTLINGEQRVSSVGNVAQMLEDLNTQMDQSTGQQAEPLPQIITVIQVAQEAGVVSQRVEAAANPILGGTHTALATLAAIADQFVSRHLNSMQSSTEQSADGTTQAVEHGITINSETLRFLGDSHDPVAPSEAANTLQFNAMMLSPFQVEVLFVLCTLLGGRRKIDAQDAMSKLGLIPILEEMFQRLPWFERNSGNDSQHDTEATQPNGIHGPNCECTPESALCVQYLRLIHNFCDRDHKNYNARQLLWSPTERSVIDSGGDSDEDVVPGLLSKIVNAFMDESDESSYRFWLASCIESFLRGVTEIEQQYVAQQGLLNHLLEDICTDKLHCSGSLQTSFDLLGELTKGNPELLQQMASRLSESSFRKLMSVATTNLVDSNVFIRSAFLSIERTASEKGNLVFLSADDGRDFTPWASAFSQLYLTHSWFDNPARLLDQNINDPKRAPSRESDWFPMSVALPEQGTSQNSLDGPLRDWSFTPVGDSFSPETYSANTMERLGWFLVANQTLLLRGLLNVVSLQNINHENICCVNTAVVIVVFAHRRSQLPMLVHELKRLDAAASPLRRTSRNSNDDSNKLGTVHTFRQLLWFWREYYRNRGRDRLSLEFSSHVRFQEWDSVVGLLTSDDASPCSLLSAPIRLPRSPYQRAAISDMSRSR